jgi:hypothetical protein
MLTYFLITWMVGNMKDDTINLFEKEILNNII